MGAYSLSSSSSSPSSPSSLSSRTVLYRHRHRIANTKQSTIRWDEHLAQFYFWRSMTQTVQFMPLLNYKSKREGYEDNHAELAEVTPVFTDEEFKSKYPDLFELPSQHNFICYVKIKDGINSRV